MNHFKNKESLQTETHKTVKALVITLSLMILGLGVLFIAATNESSQKGYVLQQQKLKNEFLKSKNSNLTTKITQAQAFSEIEDNGSVNTMEEMEVKDYVTIEDNRVN